MGESTSLRDRLRADLTDNQSVTLTAIGLAFTPVAVEIDAALGGVPFPIVLFVENHGRHPGVAPSASRFFVGFLELFGTIDGFIVGPHLI
ncbi:MAG: hypothetical protein ACI8VE_002094 [Natrialbaceae archaeon]|jgi:hypothetical protein